MQYGRILKQNGFFDVQSEVDSKLLSKTSIYNTYGIRNVKRSFIWFEPTMMMLRIATSKVSNVMSYTRALTKYTHNPEHTHTHTCTSKQFS